MIIEKDYYLKIFRGLWNCQSLSGKIECEIFDSSEFTWENTNKYFKKYYTLKSDKTLVGMIANVKNGAALLDAYYRKNDKNIIVSGWIPSSATPIGEEYEFNLIILYK